MLTIVCNSCYWIWLVSILLLLLVLQLELLLLTLLNKEVLLTTRTENALSNLTLNNVNNFDPINIPFIINVIVIIKIDREKYKMFFPKFPKTIK